MMEDIENAFGSEDIELYKRYWESREEQTELALEEDDYGVILDICIMEQDYEKALTVVDEALGTYPNDDEFWLSKVEILAGLERTDDALRLLDEIDEDYPDNEERYVLRAGLYMSQERYEEAERLFRLYDSLGGEPGLAAAGLAQCLAVRGRRKEGFRKICTYLKSAPDSIEVCNRFMVWVIEWEMLSEAEEVVRKMAGSQPYNKYLWKMLYELYELSEDFDGAREANEYTLAIDPDDYEAHGRRILYADKCDPDLVADSFSHFKPEKWNSVQRIYFYGIMADYCVDHRQTDRAVEYMKALLKEPLEKSDAVGVAYRLACQVFDREREASVREALFYFRKAETMLLQGVKVAALLESDIYRGLGQCLLVLGQEEEAFDYARRAWRICPENEWAVFDYILNLCVNNEFDKALSEVELGLSEDADDNRYKMLKGAVLYYMHKPKQAVSWLVKAFMADETLVQPAREMIADVLADPIVREGLGTLLD